MSVLKYHAQVWRVEQEYFSSFPSPPFLLFPAGNKLEKLFHRMTLLKASHSENLCLGRQARTNHFSVDLQNKIKGTQKARNLFIYLQYHNLSFTWLSCTLHVLCLYGLVYDYCGICSFPVPPALPNKGQIPCSFQSSVVPALSSLSPMIYSQNTSCVPLPGLFRRKVKFNKVQCLFTATL